MYLRVTIDVPISYEEASFIKETFINQHKCREIQQCDANRIHIDIDTWIGNQDSGVQIHEQISEQNRNAGA